MTQVMEVIAAIRAVSVTKKLLVTRKLDSVHWGVPLAMKESTVTKVNNKISLWTREYLLNSHEFVKSIIQ